MMRRKRKDLRQKVSWGILNECETFSNIRNTQNSCCISHLLLMLADVTLPQHHPIYPMLPISVFCDIPKWKRITMNFQVCVCVYFQLNNVHHLENSNHGATEALFTPRVFFFKKLGEYMTFFALSLYSIDYFSTFRENFHINFNQTFNWNFNIGYSADFILLVSKLCYVIMTYATSQFNFWRNFLQVFNEFFSIF